MLINNNHVKTQNAIEAFANAAFNKCVTLLIRDSHKYKVTNLQVKWNIQAGDDV